MTLRQATNRDADTIRALIFDVLDEYGLKGDPNGIDRDLDDIEANYINAGGLFDVLVDDDGRIVGTLGLLPLRPGVCELRKMYLHRATRGKGQGKRLLDHAIERARALGFLRIELETASALVQAIALYKRYGFTPIPSDHLAARCDAAFALDLDGPTLFE